ncbi:unnamed protein product [Diamesa serratosioi]
MSSTEFNIGLSNNRSSSRVLQPPGGGQSNIFADAEVKLPNARPSYNQQNSSNLNFVMNTVDPNILVQQAADTLQAQVESAPAVNSNSNGSTNAPAQSNGASEKSNDAAQANLPKNHHYNSTSLW